MPRLLWLFIIKASKIAWGPLKHSHEPQRSCTPGSMVSIRLSWWSKRETSLPMPHALRIDRRHGMQELLNTQSTSVETGVAEVLDASHSLSSSRNVSRQASG